MFNIQWSDKKPLLTRDQTKRSLYPPKPLNKQPHDWLGPSLWPILNPPHPPHPVPNFPALLPGPGALLCGHHKWFKAWWAASVIGLSCTPPVACGYFCYQSCTIPHTPHFRLPIWKWLPSHPFLAVRRRSWDRRQHRQAKSNRCPCPQPCHVPQVLSAVCRFPLKFQLGVLLSLYSPLLTTSLPTTMPHFILHIC